MVTSELSNKTMDKLVMVMKKQRKMTQTDKKAPKVRRNKFDGLNVSIEHD